MSEVRWIRETEEWKEALNEIGGYDFYQLPFFIQGEAQRMEGEAVAFLYTHQGIKALIPLILRPVPQDRKGKWRDALSPYGYPGILTNRTSQSQTIIEAYHAAASHEDILSTFIRLHPIQNTHLFFESEHLRQSLRGKTYSCYLPEGYESIRQGYPSNLRRDIKQLENSGYRVVVDSGERLAEWHQIYLQTMERLDASSYYHFDLGYFQALQEQLDHQLVVVLNASNEVVCGGIFTRYADCMQYHLGGTAPEAVRDAPTKLMLDHQIRQEAERGEFTWLHLGGGVGAKEDGLAKFKRRFSNRSQWFRTLELVHDQRAYKTFCDGREDTGFFPLYRAPKD